jgi:hypothetical protein
MKLRRLMGLAAAALLALTSNAPVQAQTVVLKVHHFQPGTSNVHLNLIQVWCDKIAR